MNKYLAVDEFLDVLIEDCEAVVDNAVVHGLPTKYFKIEVDEYGNPSLIEITEVSK